MMRHDNNEEAMKHISVEKALEISNKKAIDLGHDISLMKSNIDDANTAWVKYNLNNIILQHNPDLANKLAGKKYFAVYYEPKEMQRLLGLGVDGIITDRPDLLNQVLNAS